MRRSWRCAFKTGFAKLSLPRPLCLMMCRPKTLGARTRPSPHSQQSRAISRKRPAGMSVQALGKTVRLRDKNHQSFVIRQACLVCGRTPSDPHHLTFTQPRALGRRVSDEFIVPVCRMHHRELHRSGNEVAWWHRLNIDPVPVALRLWQRTRSDDQASAGVNSASEPTPAPQRAPSDRASKPHV
jgi:hypothetical protein